MPYITSSIIMQLLQGVIPKIEQWSKEGESGQRKITQITRYMTLGIATDVSRSACSRCSAACPVRFRRPVPDCRRSGSRAS